MVVLVFASLVPVLHSLVENFCLLFASPFSVSVAAVAVATVVVLLFVGPLATALAHVVVWVVVFPILAVVYDLIVRIPSAYCHIR